MGGIETLVRSTSGRNMWAIMKFFKVLPNDPLLKSLTFAQREFIIASMNEDVKEAERQAKGEKEVSRVEDKSFEKKFYSNENVELLEQGDDLDDIYKQTLKLKAKEDARQGVSENYDEVLDFKIKQVIEEHELKQRNAEAQVDDNWRKLIEKSNNYEFDDE